MKKMKKWLAALLAVMMLISLLAACGNDADDEDEDDEDEEETEQVETTEETEETEAPTAAPTVAPTEAPTVAPTNPVTPGVPSGQAEDTPAHAATLEELDAYNELSVTMTSEGAYATYAIKNVSETEGVLYLDFDGSIEVVIEINGENLTGYVRNEGETAFTPDPDADTSDVEVFMSLLETLTYFSVAQEGVTYKEIAGQTAATGAAYVYEVYEDAELLGQVWFDQATGILVRQVGADGTVMVDITALSTTNANIPAYK